MHSLNTVSDLFSGIRAALASYPVANFPGRTDPKLSRIGDSNSCSHKSLGIKNSSLSDEGQRETGVKLSSVVAFYLDEDARETCNPLPLPDAGGSGHRRLGREARAQADSCGRGDQFRGRGMDAHRRGPRAADDAGPVVLLRRHGRLQERRLDDAAERRRPRASSACSGSSSASAWPSATASAASSATR